MRIETKLDRVKVNHEAPGDIHLMVGITAPEIEEEKRKPIDVCVVIDVSTSMTEPASGQPSAPSKLVLAKKAAQRFVENLAPGDRAGLVIYSDRAEARASVALLTQQHRESLAREIAQLEVIGGTNLVDGTLRGIGCMAECPPEEGRVRRVILFTDGLPTVGIRGNERVVAAIAERLGEKTPITTIGFGDRVVTSGEGSGGYDPVLLTAIAERSGGAFYHAEGMDGILQAFALELGALRSVAATDVRIAITPGKDIRVAKLYNLCNTKERDGATAIELGQLYGGETQYVVVKLQVPTRDKALPRDTSAATVHVTGIATEGGAFDEAHDVEFRYVKPAEADTEPDATVEEQRLRLKAARAIQRAIEHAQRGEHEQAVERVRIVRMALMRFGSAESQAIVFALERIERDVVDPTRFARGAGHMHAAASSLAVRRTTSMGPSSYVDDGTYTTGSQDRSVRDMGSSGSNPPDSSST